MKIEPFPGVLTKEFVKRPYITRIGNNGCKRVRAWVLTDEQKEWLCRYYPEVENARLTKVSGIKASSLHRFARILGLKKSEKGMRCIKRKASARARRTCQENGYYDSLRGQQPSEACRKGRARMMQEIRDGKREHPFTVLKRINPRKYRKFMTQRSELRKEMIRKERRRELFGLERKTKINLPIKPYTRSQSQHRYNALKRGYFVMQDCSEGSGYRFIIYYDEKTVRSLLFERNLQADGFKIQQWTETENDVVHVPEQHV